MSLNPPEAVLIHLNAPYDPQKRHQYYEEHKHLKGRQPGSGPPGSGSQSGGGKVVKGGPRVSAANQAASEARVAAIRTRLTSLRDALQKALAAAEKKSSSSSTASTSSTKSATTSTMPQTAAQKSAARAASKKYRDTHKQEIAAKRKTIQDMSVTELRAAIATAEANLRAAVQQARTQTAPNGR